MSRQSVLSSVARRLWVRDPGHPLRVGIDGVCGAGKTTFAHELATCISALGRPVLRVDSDGFHHVRAVRYRQGRDSARGYYEDGYDFDSLRELVLVPLGGRPPFRYASRLHDLASDEVAREFADAPRDAVVLFDATFLQRGSLRDHWDEVIFLDADLESARARGTARDAAALGGIEQARAAYESRYLAACRMYLEEENPRDRASIVVAHDDPATPSVVRS